MIHKENAKKGKLVYSRVLEIIRTGSEIEKGESKTGTENNYEDLKRTVERRGKHERTEKRKI